MRTDELIVLPPEQVAGRRTTCSRVSLLMFSSSSSDRASAISPRLLSFFSFPPSVCQRKPSWRGQNTGNVIPPPVSSSKHPPQQLRTSWSRHRQLPVPGGRLGAGRLRPLNVTILPVNGWTLPVFQQQRSFCSSGFGRGVLRFPTGRGALRSRGPLGLRDVTTRKKRKWYLKKRILTPSRGLIYWILCLL